MKYYSEKLKKVYDDVESLEAAEKEFDETQALELKKREERSLRAKEIDDAWNHYAELVKSFIKDYGSFHKTYKDNDFIELVDSLWRWPF